MRSYIVFNKADICKRDWRGLHSPFIR